MPAKPVWVLIGGETLLGKEVREVIHERKLPVTLRLCSAQEEGHVLTEDEGEVSLMEPLTREILESAQSVFLAATPESHERTRAMAEALPDCPPLIDLTGYLGALPSAKLRAPVMESGLAEPPSAINVVAHPAALTLARLVELLHRRSPVRSTIATILEPVSAQDQPGIDELHKQTLGLLALESMPRAVYDSQVSFNLLPRYGDESKVKLEEAELQIEQHLAALLSPRGIPLPSIYLVHAPVFHGYCMSVRVEFESRASVVEIETWLKEGGADVRTQDLEPPSNVAAAGQSGIIVGGLRADRNDPSAYWLWVASDNLRTTAENAVLVAGLALKKVV